MRGGMEAYADVHMCRCTYVCTHTHTYLVYAHVRYIFPLRRRSTVWLPIGKAAVRWSSEHGSARNHLSILRTIQVQSDMQLMFGCRSSNLARVGQCRNHHSRRTQMLRRSGVGAVSIARLVTTSAFYVPSKSNVVCISCSAAGAACCHEQFSAGEAVCIARVVEVGKCFCFT